MHGMGDFASNPMGMEPMRAELSKRLNTYVTNIALNGIGGFDILSEFLMLMNKEVDTFATKVKSDPKLAGGFNAIGFSQGNLIIRGYIERYNNPPVYNWVSIHGPNLGVSSIPHCIGPGIICKLLATLNKYIIEGLV